MDEKPKEGTLLEQLIRESAYLQLPETAPQILSVDDEVKRMQRFMWSQRSNLRWSKSESYIAEIEFCIANDLVRHICAIAAHFCLQQEYREPWRPVGFFKGGGSYREIHLLFREYVNDTSSYSEYTGTLTREQERGERYTLSVTHPDIPNTNSIVDILSVLGVPRSYLDGLFDMLDYGMEAADSEYTKKLQEVTNMAARLRNIRADIHTHSQELQAVKRQKKWSRKRYPKVIPGDASSMPAVPTAVVPLLTAQIEYYGCSGLYFLWDTERKCAYVGKSKNIGSRLSGHHKTTAEHAVSILPMAVTDIHYAELYYIWALRPYLNREGMETARELQT